VAVTTELLARLHSLDDLLELVAALGFAPCGDELNPAARERLGLGADALGVRRAAVLGRCGAFRVYGAVLKDASRTVVSQAIERLSRATAGQRHLLFVLDGGATLAAAAALSEASGFRARQLRFPLMRPSAVAAEILGGLAPRPDDTPVSLSLRVADTLAEEGLTRRFFREFTRLHERAADALSGVPRAGPDDRRDLALVILTRVLFLYFVQSKGWLAGRSDFLPSLLDTALRAGRPFHRTAFEPLCFGALSTPIGARAGAARALGDVPFLNGGMFERHALERRFPEAALPDAMWRALFDELFERFHFTVRERDDDAIDPEMLGRVFEGLMARDRRRHSGTYFTPRPLLRRAVALALHHALQWKDADAVRAIRILDPAVGSGAFLLEALVQLEAVRAERCPDEPRASRRRAIVRDCLFGVDLDPMAVRLAELRLWLAMVTESDAAWDAVAPLPNLDLNLRQGDSLVSPLDLAGGAPAPALSRRLRAVAERRTEYFAATGRHKASLARRIRADERAIAVATTDAGISTLTAKLSDAASVGRDLFGRRGERTESTARRVATWRRHRRELLSARRRLVEDDALPFFAYDVHFGDILAGGGFDVVLGNPPWVRGERLTPSMRTLLMARYRSFRATAPGRSGFSHLPDLSVAFVERALSLARPDGIVTLILPAKLLRAGYAGPLRALLRDSATVLHLEDRAHGAPSGFAATVFPMILALRRRRPEIAEPLTVTLACAGMAVGGMLRQGDLPLARDDPRSPWIALPDGLNGALRAALAAGPSLARQFRPRLGVKTGANEIFVRPPDRVHELPAACRRPALLGRDIAPFAATPSAFVLSALDDAGRVLREVPQEVRFYLGPHAGTLARRADARRVPPWALFRTDLLQSRWVVLWRDIAPRLEAVAIDSQVADAPVPLNTCYGVAVPDAYTAHWLSAWLNSRPIRAVACALAERAGGGAFRFSAATVGALPLPRRTDHPDVRALAAVARTAHRGGIWNADALDAHALCTLALDPDAAAGLDRLDAALRRDTGGDR